jgi:glutaminase
MKAKLKGEFAERFRAFPDYDAALEWCEDRLLDAVLPSQGPDGAVAPEAYELFAGLEASELATVVALLERRRYAAGQTIVEFGAPAEELFVLARGRASAVVELAGGARKRLATFSAGMAFGEMAVLDRAPRSAVVTADTDLECDLLKVGDLDRLSQTHPRISITLLRNLALSLSSKLRKANREIRVFDY